MSPASCPPSRLLSDYLDGQLIERQRQRLENHLRQCTACATLVRELEQVERTASELEDEPPPNDLWAAIRTRIQGAAIPRIGNDGQAPGPPAAHPPARPGRLSIGWLQAAAVLAVVIGASVLGTLALIPGETEKLPAVAIPGGSVASALQRLDPESAAIVRANLAAIDAALVEVRAALDEHPGDAYLARHLAETRQRRADLVGRVTAVAGGRM